MPTDHQYPRDYTDRQLLESIWRKLDGLAHMLAPHVTTKKSDAPDAHPDDIDYVVDGWTRKSLTRKSFLDSLTPTSRRRFLDRSVLNRNVK